MKKLFLMAIVLIILIHGIFAQQSEYKTGSLLWKISGKDLTSPSYILGTFHLKPGAFLDSIPGAKSALELSGQVVGELLLNDVAEMQKQMSLSILMSPDTTYQMLYSDEDYQYVDAQLSKMLGAGLGQLGVLKPTGIQLVITVQEYQKYFPDFNPTNSLDTFVQSVASEAGKPVLGLETIDDQNQVLFASSSLQRQADVLLCELRNMDETMSDMSLQINAYNQADLNLLYNYLYDQDNPCASTLDEINTLNKDRNDVWMTKLPALMKEKSSFVAVGALHLAGKEGLLNQLEQAGYTVDPVK